MDGIIQLISNVGFPIFAFILMYQQSNTTIAKNTEAITELTKEIQNLKE